MGTIRDGIVGWEATVVACQANKPQNSLAKLCINGSTAPGRTVWREGEWETEREREGSGELGRQTAGCSCTCK